jgi:hypothetical protein
MTSPQVSRKSMMHIERSAVIGEIMWTNLHAELVQVHVSLRPYTYTLLNDSEASCKLPFFDPSTQF